MQLDKRERVIIVGCGRLGSRLATMLSDKGYQVVIIDNEEASFKKLPESFGGFQVKADGIDLDTLKYVDIDDASMLVACTGNDNLNSLIAQIASRIYGVPNVYVRFEDTDKEKRYLEGRFGAIPFLGDFKNQINKMLWQSEEN